mgnify:CR=1 FL=1
MCEKRRLAVGYFKCRYSVDRDTPSTSRMSVSDIPPVRIRFACLICVPDIAGGRPPSRPWARATASPRLVRSRMRLRSNSANAPKME